MKYGLIFVVCLLFIGFSVRGEQSVETQEKKLSELKSRIKQTDGELKNLQHDKNRLFAQLKELDVQYGLVARRANKVQKKIQALEKMLQVVNQNLAVTRKAIKRQKAELENQVRSAYAMGGKERLKVLLNQQDPGLYSRMLTYYDYLNKSRMLKLQLFETDYLNLQQLEKVKIKESNALAATLKRHQREQNELHSVRKERDLLLTELKKRYSSKAAQLDSLKINEQKVQKLILTLGQKTDDVSAYQSAHDKPFAQLKGRLPWPIAGRLDTKFGSPRAEGRWDGVLINAKEGADIRAVNGGRVVYADWLRGYGLLIIINHGGHFMTLYAFNQSLYKAEGDTVAAGDIIASVGTSGGRSKAALYFGIRKHGKPVDPINWCRKINKDRVG